MRLDLKSSIEEWTAGTIPGGFELRSGYYAGRPPSQGDINTEVLEGIYEGLARDVSHVAAVNFVLLVNSLDDMSASSFVVAFERFAHNDFSQKPVAQSKKDRDRIDAHGDEAIPQAMGLMGMVIGGRPDESEIRKLSDKVKGEFLARHSEEIPPDKRR